MKAIFYARFGGANVLKLGELPDPVPGPGELLVRVRAAGVNPVDWKLREGHLKAFFPYAFPVIPGWDAAGEVAGLGAGVIGFALGDRVVAYCRKDLLQAGCYAEFVTVRAEVVARVPAALDDVAAAALPVTGLTAWQGLVEFASTRGGQTVFVPAAAGGVGTMVVPLAKHLGARVIATCSATNAAFVTVLGADHVIDYRAADWVPQLTALAPDGIDVFLDSVGGDTQALTLPLMKRGGAVIALNSAPEDAQVEALGLRAIRLFSRPQGEHLQAIVDLTAQGVLPLPPIDVLPLEKAAEAQQRSQDGHVRGKLVLSLN